VRFVELLRATVLLSGAAATTLALLTLVGAGRRDDGDGLVLACAGLWLAACVLGTWLGARETGVTASVRRALAGARASSTLPELRPAATLLNRLWPLLVVTLVAGGLTFVAPAVTGIGCAFCLTWALSWRLQHAAVQAVEERDGVTFYVDRGPAVGPPQLLRLPGFRRELPVQPG
jgi:hypothetical protein